MTFAKIGIDLSQFKDPANLHAYLGTCFRTSEPVAWASRVRPISYAVLVIGANLAVELWGYGYATYEDAGRAAAANHAAEFRLPDQTLVLHGRGLLPHVGPNGHVHSAGPNGHKGNGEPYDAYEWLEPIASDIKKGRTMWVEEPKRGESAEFLAATKLAAGSPWAAALKYRPHFNTFFESSTRNYIIGRNDDPDPLNALNK